MKHKTLVYFIQAASGGPIKIGKTTRSIKNRHASLQTGNPEKLIVLATTERYTEGELHKRFASLRLGGEWFKPAITLLLWIQTHTQVTHDGHRTFAKSGTWNETQ
jgi:hypothetical protein